jgi:hypothetical protein
MIIMEKWSIGVLEYWNKLKFEKLYIWRFHYANTPSLHYSKM